MCLGGHKAPGTDIGLDVTFALRTKYTQDIAVGYDNNQVRGIWSANYRKHILKNTYLIL